MQHIYSPWRAAYFTQDLEDECVFCAISKSSKDEQHRVFYRDEFCYFVMNLYPYTPGHFMLIPHAHADSPHLLDSEIWAHISGLVPKAFEILYDFGAQGVNFGINGRKAAGAGIPEHLHLHFIPRYIGDTNFITALGDTRIYGTDFDNIFYKIAKISKKYLKA